MNLTKYEKETVIRYNDEEKIAYIYTTNKTLTARLDKLCKKYPDSFKLVATDEVSKKYEIDKKRVSITSPRIYTEEQKEEMRQRLKNLQSKSDI